MLPRAAEKLHMGSSNKEGWLSGLLDELISDGDPNLHITIAFPVAAEPENCVGKLTEQIDFVGFYEDISHPEKYDPALEEVMSELVRKVCPDVVHIFGTEYPHTLAMCRAFSDKERILIGIQGVCNAISQVYYASLPERVVHTVTFRDIVKKDSLRKQKEKFENRARHEAQAVMLAGNVAGRTAWDKAQMEKLHPGVTYYELRETLRETFYKSCWKEKECIPGRIFLCQGDYPLKGLHYAIGALKKLKSVHPEARLVVAGNPIIRPKTLKGRLKISGYGYYIRRMLEALELEQDVEFLGNLSAEELKREMLKSNVFLCASAVENSPNSLGEAMLMEMPVVTAYVGGIPSLFEKDVDGIAFEGYSLTETEANSQEAVSARMALALEQMLDAKERWLEYGKNAGAHARINHNEKDNLEQLKSIYAAIASKEQKS